MDVSGRILIIDDEAALRQTLARILQRAGHEVTTAGSGQEGLALLAGAAFDLVYLDIRMPDMSGVEVLQTIHSNYPGTSVILFTAQPDVNSAIEALRQGATDYLLKPLKPQALIDRTQAVLADKEKEQRKRGLLSEIESLQTQLKNLDQSGKVQAVPANPAGDAGGRFITRGKLSLDLHTRRVNVDGRTVSLPPAAFDYLVVLARHSPGVVDFRTLVVEAQGYQAETREAQELVKWHIHSIRQAIEPDKHDPVYLITVRGTGYRLVSD
jgi:DNA-binding response OmpR family regulator